MQDKMSRIYDNQPLTNLPLVNIDYSENGMHMTLHKVQSKGETDRLGTDEARKLISPASLTQYSDRHGSSDLAALWLTETQATGTEFELGDTLRVKTQGDGPFVFSITKMDAVSSTVGNYAGGESVGASWTDKIMDAKSQAPASETQGAADDEWDD